MRTLTRHKYKQDLTKKGVKTTVNCGQFSFVSSEPSLEMKLSNHRIWTYSETWLSLSKDLEVQTFADVEQVQSEMSTYNVMPELFANVTTQLVNGIGNTNEEEVKQSMEVCEKRVEEYSVTYEEKGKAKEEAKKEE